YREIRGICEGAKEAGWSGFLKHLKERGLRGVRLIISDACMGLSESGVLPRGSMATVHRALVPQYLQPRSLDQGSRDRGDAQGDPCGRGNRSGAAEGVL